MKPPRYRRVRPRPRWPLFVIAFLLMVPLVVPARVYWELTRPLLNKHLINKYAALHRFDPIFIMSVVRVESGFVSQARSRRGAVGLMQLMPETAAEVAVREGLVPETIDLEDPDTNIRLGVRYLAILRDEFKEDQVAILAAYNAGPSNARAWRRGEMLGIEQIAFPETRAFVSRVSSSFRWFKRMQRVKEKFFD